MISHRAYSKSIPLAALCATFAFSSGPTHAHGNFEVLTYFPIGFLAALPLILLTVRIAALGWLWLVICFMAAFAASFLASLVPLGYIPLGHTAYGAFLTGFLPAMVSTALTVFSARRSTQRKTRS